jgi:hypothetical protein
VLTWLAVLSTMNRIPLAGFGLDATISLALLYLAIGPSGAAVSVDRLWARWRTLKTNINAPMSPLILSSATFALRLIQVHFCFIYLATGLSKVLGAPWWNGTAFWTILANNEMAPFHVPGYTTLLIWLAKNRWLLEIVLSVGVLYTIAIEISLPFLIWNPKLRGWMIVGGVLLHVGIGVTMDHLATFSLMMLTLLLSFVPAETVRTLLAWLSCGRSGLRLVFDSRVPGQMRMARLVRTFDVWHCVTVEDVAGTSGKQRLQLRIGEQSLSGYLAFEKLTRSLRLLWPIGALTWLPGVGRLGRHRYP